MAAREPLAERDRLGLAGSPSRASWLTFTDLRFIAGYLALIFLGTAALRMPGSASPWFLPFLATFPAMMVLFDRYAEADLPGALREMLWAALWMTGGMLCAFAFSYPITPGPVASMGVVPVLQGESYVEEMLIWIRTGEGPEGDPAQFVPIHLRHLGIISAVSLASAGVIGFLFGAVQMAYMNAYVYVVGASANSAPMALVAMLLAWHSWSVIRVVSFITLATALGYPLFARLQQPRRLIPWREIGRFCLIGLALEAVDIALKTVLAEPVRQSLLRLTGLGDAPN